MAESLRGGRHKGAGRPTLSNKVEIEVTLTTQHADIARWLGGGNISAGIRRALEDVAELAVQPELPLND